MRAPSQRGEYLYWSLPADVAVVADGELRRREDAEEEALVDLEVQEDVAVAVVDAVEVDDDVPQFEISIPLRAQSQTSL